MNVFRRSRAITASLGMAIIIAGCTGGDGGASGGADGCATPSASSNTLTNNGWREEMICSINAQALVSGEVESLSINHRDTDAAGQLEDHSQPHRRGRRRDHREPRRPIGAR